MVGSSLGGCDRLVVVVVSGCVCLVAACTIKLNQYSILVIWGEGRCYTVGMCEGHTHTCTCVSVPFCISRIIVYNDLFTTEITN